MFGRSFFDIGKRIALWALSGLTILSGYGLTKLEPFGAPHLLPLTALDLAIPLVPWTIWLYGSGTKAALIAWLLVPDAIAGRRLFFTLSLAALLCWVVFAVYPTTYPRDLYPLPAPGPSPFAVLTHAEFAELRAVDSPANCLPSMHVALAWGLALCARASLQTPWTRAIPIVWAIVVSLCTLTTKQHYVIDVPSGMAAGVFAWAVVHRGVQPGAEPFWGARRSLVVEERDRRAVSALLARVRAHQWALSDIALPLAGAPLDPLMERLLNEVIYVEEIARLNFELLRDASEDPELSELYGLFAVEERRHADGLRKLIAAHGGELQPPGLGNALVLDQFDTLDPRLDATLVAVSTPVFETFLDAGTIPFLRDHPSLQSPGFSDFVVRVCQDEVAHLALNWIQSRAAARHLRGPRGWGQLLNPNVWRGMLAVPFMSLDVYSLAGASGYDFATLLPPFGRLWRLHERYPELGGFSLWWSYRLFVAAGALATIVCVGLSRIGLLGTWFWVWFTLGTRHTATLLFGPGLLAKRGLPPIPARMFVPKMDR